MSNKTVAKEPVLTQKYARKRQAAQTKQASKVHKYFTKSNVMPKVYLCLIILVLCIIWQMGVEMGKLNAFTFSSPKNVIKDIFVLFSSGEIWPHIGATLYASFMGVLIGTVCGVIVAFIFGNIKTLAAIFDPLFVGLYGLPKLALGPLFVVWFGIGIQAKIVMATIMVFFLVFFNAYAGFRDVDVNLINMMKMMGASKFQIITKLILPSCIPWITASLRSGVGAAVLGAIVGEYLGATKGLGWMVQSAGGLFNITRVFSCIFILMFLMALLDYGVKYLEKRVLRWRPTAD